MAYDCSVCKDKDIWDEPVESGIISKENAICPKCKTTFIKVLAKRKEGLKDIRKSNKEKNKGKNKRGIK